MKKQLLRFLCLTVLSCCVANNLNAQWQFLKGYAYNPQFARHGILNTESTYNNPEAARNGSTTWMYQGNLFLFSGGVHNDIWKFNVSTGLWTWIKGPSTWYQSGTYGTQGIENPNNNPGYRDHSPFWIMGAKVYVFSGDMWSYNMDSNNWTWLGGQQNQARVEGPVGTFAANHNPGNRHGATCFDYSGGLYLYAGEQATSAPEYKNDVWKYDTTLQQWALINKNFTTWVNDTIAPSGGFAQSWLWGSKLYVYGGVSGIYGSQHQLMEYDISSNHWQRKSDGVFLPVYGTRNVYSATNCPGGRSAGQAWIKDGRFYLYGGYNEYNTLNETHRNYFNDLWEYDPTLEQWRWVEGDSIPNQNGVYNNKGVTSASGKMGGRAGALFWQNDSLSYFANGSGYCIYGQSVELNDVWRYNKNTSRWTWMGGVNNATRYRASYQLQVGNYNNRPAETVPTATWHVGDDVYTYYVDYYSWEMSMWKYNVLSNNWTMLKADTGIYCNPGVKNIYANHNWPGRRESGTAWTANGKCYIFGGLGTNGASTDLWEYDPALNNWRWIAGNTSEDLDGHFGTKGVAHAANTPDARSSPGVISWGTKSYLFGGDHPFVEVNFQNDLWVFDHITGLWTWIHGPKEREQPGVLQNNLLNSFDPLNRPGPRRKPTMWALDGKIYMYSGYGPYAYTNSSFWDEDLIPDFWVYNIASNQWACIQKDGNFMSGITNRYGTYGTQGIPDPTSKPGVREGSGAFVYDQKLWMFAGHGFGASYDYEANDELWNYNPQTNLWTWVSGHIDVEDQPDVYPDQPNVNIADIGPGSGYCNITFEHNNKMYVLTSEHQSIIHNQVWGYSLCTQPGTCTSIAPDVNLGPDFVLCYGEALELNAGNVGCHYVWNTGDTTQIIYAQNAGTYWVTVTDVNALSATDTIVVTATDQLPTATGISAVQTLQHIVFQPENAQNTNICLWDFGDGEVGFGNNVSHDYATTGSYQVRLILQNQCGIDTLIKTVNISEVSGISGFAAGNNLRVYPNPASNVMQVTFDEGNIDRIELYDMQGRRVLQQDNKQKLKAMAIGIETLRNGMYFLQVFSGNYMLTRKINKQ